MRYRVMPLIGKVKENQSAVEVSDQLEALTNEGAREWWKFEKINNINTKVQPGCLAGTLGVKADYVRFDMVFFRKEIDLPIDEMSISKLGYTCHVERQSTGATQYPRTLL